MVCCVVEVTHNDEMKNVGEKRLTDGIPFPDNLCFAFDSLCNTKALMRHDIFVFLFSMTIYFLRHVVSLTETYTIRQFVFFTQRFVALELEQMEFVRFQINTCLNENVCVQNTTRWWVE